MIHPSQLVSTITPTWQHTWSWHKAKRQPGRGADSPATNHWLFSAPSMGFKSETTQKRAGLPDISFDW